MDTVLRRYFAGYAVLTDFVAMEVRAGGASNDTEITGLLRQLSSQMGHLLMAVSDEHRRALSERLAFRGLGRGETVWKLLSGEAADAGGLGYDLTWNHVAIVVRGADGIDFLPEMAQTLDRRVLSVRPDSESYWVWLGGRRPFAAEDVSNLLRLPWQSHAVSIGDPCRGIAGWRLSHFQAREALPVAARLQRVVRYRDVALVASALQNTVLSESLRQIYLSPLSVERDGGKSLRETLRVYLRSGRNISSTAAALGVNRKTVTSRIGIAEARIGQSLDDCLSALDVALCLNDLSHHTDPPDT